MALEEPNYLEPLEPVCGILFVVAALCQLVAQRKAGLAQELGLFKGAALSRSRGMLAKEGAKAEKENPARVREGLLPHEPIGRAELGRGAGT